MTIDMEFYIVFAVEIVVSLLLFYLFYKGLKYINRDNSENEIEEER